ncbi:alpha/beta hydrolase [Massilia niastensis]|uniref:alpha/beta hydrolase n=1 Tax=Massilia niastensis TaxID=544911 RepID=UPI00036CCAFB|nr:alpha/beta hydrolase [Massilia niastensis]
MQIILPLRCSVAVAALLLAHATYAQATEPSGPPAKMDVAAFFAANPPKPASPATEASIPLLTAGSPATETWETMFGHRTVRNVTQPAVYPVRPAPGKANGTALVIAPGGAFLSLSFDTEGMMLANYLAERGVTCFVLKYRLDSTPTDTAGFMRTVGARMRSAKPRMTRGDLIDSKAQPLAQQDGLAAIQWVRTHASDYGLDPQRIGIIGFSAGGMTAMNVATGYSAASRPDFVGVIYGGAPERPVPKDAPPIFVALAADDGLLGYAGVPIFEDWRAAGKLAELHIYAAGEHGFGMRGVPTSADHWPEHFVQWLKASHLMP